MLQEVLYNSISAALAPGDCFYLPRKPVQVLYTCQWCEFGIVYVWCIFTRVWNVFHRFHLVYNWCRVHQYHSCCCTHVVHTVFWCHFGVISLVVGIYYVWNGMCNTYVQSHVLYPCTLRVSYQPEVYFPCHVNTCNARVTSYVQCPCILWVNQHQKVYFPCPFHTCNTRDMLHV